jgi:hypothetical protein
MLWDEKQAAQAKIRCLNHPETKSERFTVKLGNFAMEVKLIET